jgi:hypothetical protein
MKIINFQTPGVLLQSQGDPQRMNLNDSLVYFSLDKLRKDELVKTVHELQSKVKEKSNIKQERSSMSFTEIIKLFCKKLYHVYVSMFTFLSKLTIISLIFRLFSKIKIVRFI